MRDESGATWVSVAAAAAALAVSEKTVRRRIKAGELDATKVPLDGGGIAWRVNIGDKSVDVMDTGMDTRRNRSGQRDGHNHAHAQGEVGTEVDAMDNATDTRAGTVMDNGVGEVASRDAQEIARQRDEITFLRGLVEQHQRSEAELRASLRDALRAMPKQLTTGATNGPQAPPTATAANDSPATANGAQQPAKRGGGPLTYGDIADELERMINNENPNL